MLFEMLWGPDFNGDYNSIGETFLISFGQLQVYRFLALMFMMMLSSIYFYIYMIEMMKYDMTYVLSTTLMAFTILFREAGRQKCY